MSAFEGVQFQNLRVFARRLNIALNENKVRGYLKACDVAGVDISSRTGAMLVCAGIYFSKDHGNSSLKPALVAATAFNFLNHNKANVIGTAVSMALANNGEDPNGSLRGEVVKFLSTYRDARNLEKSKPSITNMVLHQIRNPK